MKRRLRWGRIFLALLILLGIVLAVLLHSTEWLVSLGGKPEGALLDRVKRSAQYRDGRFRNVEEAPMTTSSNREMFRRQFFGDEQREPLGTIPVVHTPKAQLPVLPESGLRATWLGWASVLVEIDGHRVLTDPVWSDRCSPSTLVGPKRFHEPPIALDDLPSIDVVVISHDHYDHLDMPVIRTLAARGTHFAVPLGIGAHLRKWDVPAAQIHDLDWHEGITVRGLRVTATPSRHYSGRNPLLANQTLWAAWSVRGPAHSFFFSGDSGYSADFRKIGETYGPFDLSLIKIGAYDDSWKSIHMLPEEAIEVHRDVRAKVLLPIHWATFNLGFHDWVEPPQRAIAAAQKAGVTIVVPRPGQRFEPTVSLPPIEKWWEF
jgi:L-ascorbate metabolism protein UlaG (beta-lactamase superfamily)